MQTDRSISNVWLWGLAAVAVLILLLGRAVGPKSLSTDTSASADTAPAASMAIEPIGDAPESYPVLAEPRETGLQNAFDQQQAAEEPQSGL